MSHPSFTPRAIASLLTGLLLLAPTVISASAESEEVGSLMVSAASTDAASVLPYQASPEHPLITLTTGGWVIDRGGAGIYFDRFAEDGD